jgi:hypothetical protein
MPMGTSAFRIGMLGSFRIPKQGAAEQVGDEGIAAAEFS